MNVGTPYKRASIDDRYDAIVIGSGIGGMGVASLLARHGDMRVLVLERHYTAGGYTQSFQRPGYEWDVGLHYVGEVAKGQQLRQVLDHLTDGTLDFADIGDVYDTAVIGDFRFDFVRGVEALQAKLGDHFPRERDAIDRYFKRLRSTGRMAPLYFTERCLPSPVSAVLGGLMRYPAMRNGRLTTSQVLDQCGVSDAMLRGLLTYQWGNHGLPPGQSSFLIHALVCNHYLEGAGYPVGGSGEIARKISPSIEAAGGKVVTRAEVRRVVIEGGRAVGVELVDGRIIRSTHVVSNAGAALTFGELVSDPRAVPVTREATGGLAGSVAHLALFIGLDRTADQLELPRQNYWIHSTPDFDANMRSFFDDERAELPLGMISCPSGRDPEFARRFPGRGTCQMSTVVPFEPFEQYVGTRWGKRGDGYEEHKARLTDRLLQMLLRYLPQMRGAIDHLELSTPVTTRHFAAHPRGEIYGLTHTPDRFRTRWLRPQTPIPGLFLTGADVCSGGIVGSVFGAGLTASALLRRNIMGKTLAGHVTREPGDRPAAMALPQ